MTEYAPGQYTPEQYVAFSFVVWDRRDPDAWRKGINRERLSFTEPEWGPLQQRYGSLEEGFRVLGLSAGDTSALGFAAHSNPDGSVNTEDAERKRKQWRKFLTTKDDT